MNEKRVDELVAKWVQSAKAGSPISLERLCANDLELKELVAARIRKMKRTKAGSDTDVQSQTKGTGDQNFSQPIAATQHESTSRDKRVDIAGEKIGDYVLLEEIARGGMGVVFKARQEKLNRIVALKMILSGQFADDTEIQRFRAEAESAAKLDHPNIIPIYEVGEFKGRHFFSMSFVDGESLGKRLTDGPLAPEAAARLLLIITQAIAYAHRRGVIHRDLKPANILLAFDEAAIELPEHGSSSSHNSARSGCFNDRGLSYSPRVTDFGLAKVVTGEDGMTLTGQILGTPEYMSPEQARGEMKQVSASTDIYSLGAILYSMLVGRPPFRAASAFDTIMQVQSADPVSPRRINPSIPRDLETICLKCLEKQPAKRYQTAQELVDELQRFLTGQPIKARRVSAIERTWRWCRRNPAVASLIAGAFVCLLLLSGAALYYARQQQNLAEARSTLAADTERLRLEEVAAGKRTATNLYTSLLGQAKALQMSRKPGYRSQVFQLLKEAQSLKVANERNDEIREIVISCLGDPIGLDPIEATEIIRTKPTRISSEFRELIQDGSTGEYAVSPSGRLLALESGRQITVFNGQLNTQRVGLRQLGGVHSMAFTPDNEQLVCGCEEGVVIYSVDDMEPRGVFRSEVIRDIIMSPEGERYAVKSSYGTVDLWSLNTHRHVARFQVDSSYDIEFSANGEYLLETSQGEVVNVRKVRNTPETTTLVGHTGGIPFADFSPDGKLLASVSKDSTIRIWDSITGEVRHIMQGAQREVQTVDFHPSGKWLASGDWYGNIQFWNAQTGRSAGAFRHSYQIWQLRFNPTGDLLFTADKNGLSSFKVQIQGDQLVLSRKASTAISGGGMTLDISPVKTQVGCSSWSGGVFLWNGVDNSEPIAVEPKIRCCIGFDQSGNLRFPAQDYSVAAIHRHETGKVETTPMRIHGEVCEYSKDGKLWFSRSPEKSLAMIDVSTGKDVFLLPPSVGKIWGVQLDPAGERVAVFRSDGELKIWNLETVRSQLAKFGFETPSARTTSQPASPFYKSLKELAGEIADETKRPSDELAKLVREWPTGWQEPSEYEIAAVDQALSNRLARSEGSVENTIDVLQARASFRQQYSLTELALADFEQIHKLQPENLDALVRAMQIEKQQGETEAVDARLDQIRDAINVGAVNSSEAFTLAEAFKTRATSHAKKTPGRYMPEVIADWCAAVELGVNNPSVISAATRYYCSRAYYACLYDSNWENALRCKHEEMKRSEKDSTYYLRMAPLWVLLGQREAYRQNFAQSLSQFANTNEPVQSERFCKAFLLLPNPEIVKQLPAAAMQEGIRNNTVSAGNRPYFVATQALLSLRRKEHDAAINTAKTITTGHAAHPIALLVQTLANYHLGNVEQARTLYANVSEASCALVQTRISDQVIHAVLRWEAEQLLFPDGFNGQAWNAFHQLETMHVRGEPSQETIEKSMLLLLQPEPIVWRRVLSVLGEGALPTPKLPTVIGD